jgi:hypothetical protein
MERHVVGIQAHLTSMLDFPQDDDADLEEDDEDDDSKSLFLEELKQLVEQAETLTTK